MFIKYSLKTWKILQQFLSQMPDLQYVCFFWHISMTFYSFLHFIIYKQCIYTDLTLVKQLDMALVQIAHCGYYARTTVHSQGYFFACIEKLWQLC